MTNEKQQSTESCPVCGANELELLYYPTVDVTGVRPYDELLGMGNAKPDQLPGIGCRACGSEWATLAEFRADPG